MTMLNLAGQTLGQYELREVLGAGGMGIAYRGYQRNLEREVAIKILFPGLAAEAGYTERFYREAKTAASLEHAHIVPVYDYGMQGTISYVVMRLLVGGTLEDRMTRRAEQNLALPSLGEVSRLLTQLASALDYAHHRGVIHRDIKPANVMFDDQGVSYITDFGIAKLLESSTSYTSTGSPIGTPLYMPPEQWRSETLTPAADQYALAITIYQLLTGRLPFEATTTFGLLHKHLNEEPTPPQTYRADVPLKVQETLNRALEKDPADRWESVTAMAEAFDSAIRGQTGELSGFFEGAITRKKGMMLPGANSLVMISPTSPLVTATQAPPAYKQPVFWVMGVLLLAAVAVVLILLLVQGGGKNNTPKPLSDDSLRSTVLAELVISQTAQQNAAQTANAGVALALTGTAQQWTPTPTPNLGATETRQATLYAQATQDTHLTATQEAVFAQATGDAQSTALAGATSTQDALLIIAGETADARLVQTQTARDKTATVEAQAQATQDTQSQAATADAAATGTQIAGATATQAQLLIVAQATADARATGTQVAADQLATANAATSTPTPTPIPPDLQAVYNGNEFVLINISGRTLDVSHLVFESKGGAGDQRSFGAVTWSSTRSDPAQMGAGGCYQVVTTTATQIAPERSVCPVFLGWFRANTPDRYFWLAPQPNDAFTVRLADSAQPFATCSISAGKCDFALPR